MATTAACRAATSGSISGTGLAMAKTMLSGAIDATSASVRMFGADTPRKTSAPRMASESVPVTPSAFVFSAIQAWLGCSPRARRPGPGGRPVDVGDDDVPAPRVEEQLEDRGPRAPAPLMTTRTSSSRLPTTRSALRRAASATMAVPCWSSWNTGMSSSSRRRASISKQRGRRDVLEVDPREHRGDGLDGADDLLDVGGVEADREGVDVGEPLEQRGLALHDGQRGERADVAEPQHGGAVGDDGDGVALDGEAAGVLGVLGDGGAHAGHARRVDHRQVVRVRIGTFDSTDSLPPRCMRKVRSETRPISTPSTSRIRWTIASACSGSCVSIVRSMRPSSRRMP